MLKVTSSYFDIGIIVLFIRYYIIFIYLIILSELLNLTYLFLTYLSIGITN